MNPNNDIAGKNESALRRWSRLKSERSRPPASGVNNDASVATVESDNESQVASVSESERPELTDADMPPVESLKAGDDVSGFLSPQVSAALRKRALRAVFSQGRFNLRDGLDDYDEDFTKFPVLTEMTAELRKRLSERRQAQESEAAQESDAKGVAGETGEGVAGETGKGVAGENESESGTTETVGANWNRDSDPDPERDSEPERNSDSDSDSHSDSKPDSKPESAS